ncbi:hypothetical protein HOLleu_21835 [Holothuria leucospilota]|uniref:Uncharacterized protein n=1 Tax=Holothuria leucospilota TaxID=206669 RepID=A0A9Q1H737_HOLLE|nr:hypothetical protein HOLleu_21835 [Holothuria leucospilota]
MPAIAQRTGLQTFSEDLRGTCPLIGKRIAMVNEAAQRLLSGCTQDVIDNKTSIEWCVKVICDLVIGLFVILITLKYDWLSTFRNPEMIPMKRFHSSWVCVSHLF